MPKKERKGGEIPWKAMVLSAGGGLLLYLLWQPLWALLIHRETAGPGLAPVFTAVSGGISLMAAVLILGRGCRSRRLALGCGSAGIFLAALLLLSLGYNRAEGFPVLLPGTGAAVFGGGILAAMMGGGGGKRTARPAGRRRR